jgi:hypothetical protein
LDARVGQNQILEPLILARLICAIPAAAFGAVVDRGSLATDNSGSPQQRVRPAREKCRPSPHHGQAPGLTGDVRGRKKRWNEDMQARFPEGTFARIAGVVEKDEDRTDFVRKAVERELARRESARHRRRARRQ